MKSFLPPAAVLLLGLLGCGSGEASFKLVPVTGTITLNNKPLADAQVAFMPDATNAVSTPGTDLTGPDGNYRLKFKTRTGVSPGKYKVSVALRNVFDGIKIPEEFKDDPAAYVMRVKAAEDAKRSSKKAVTKVAEVPRGEFEADVPPDGGVFDFDVKVTAKKGSK